MVGNINNHLTYFQIVKKKNNLRLGLWFTKSQITLCEEKCISVSDVPNKITSIAAKLLLNFYNQGDKDFWDPIVSKNVQLLNANAVSQMYYVTAGTPCTNK